LIADTGATAGPYAGDGIVDTNAGETAAGEASASSSGQPQNSSGQLGTTASDTPIDPVAVGVGIRW